MRGKMSQEKVLKRGGRMKEIGNLEVAQDTSLKGKYGRNKMFLEIYRGWGDR